MTLLAATPDWAVAVGVLAPLIISLSALIYTSLNGRQMASMATLERSESATNAKIAALEREVEKCDLERKELAAALRHEREENLSLMRQLLKLNGGAT